MSRVAADYEERLWKMIAFLGKYGHQPANVCLSMTTTELGRLANAVAEIMREEADAQASAFGR